MKLESLEELRVFAQIVESGSLTGAARALGMPANTISRRLAALEQRLDTRLLYRSTRSLSLSESGRSLLGRARRILDEAEAAETILRQESEGLVGLVRVGVPSVLTGGLIRALKPLMAQHPGLRLRIGVYDRPINPVVAGLDVVVTGGALPDSTLIARKLTDVTLVLVASADYLAAHGTPTSPTDLAQHQTLQWASEPPHRTWVLTHSSGEQHVVPVEGRMEFDDGRALMDALAAGVGVGLTSPRVMEDLPSLVRILPEFRGMTFPVYAVYPASNQRSARLQAVVEALLQALQVPGAGA